MCSAGLAAAMAVAAAGSWFDLPQPVVAARQQVPLNMAIIFWNLKRLMSKYIFYQNIGPL